MAGWPTFGLGVRLLVALALLMGSMLSRAPFKSLESVLRGD
jgi:hypothetical protein